MEIVRHAQIAPEWLDGDERGLVITPRSYEEVMGLLRMPEEAVLSGSRVLSVGEGLSDFIRILNQRRQVLGFGTDPVYEVEGMRIVWPDCIEETLELLADSPEKIQSALTRTYGLKEDGKSVPPTLRPLVGYRPELSKRDEFLLPDKKTLVAGSVYDLPFADQSFDYIFGTMLAQHMNSAKAIPELCRVAKSEVRLVGYDLTVDTENNIFYVGSVHYESEYNDTYIVHGKGEDVAFNWLASQTDLSIYVYVNHLGNRSELRRKGYYQSSLVIIKKDGQAPQFTPLTEVDLEKFKRRLNSREAEQGISGFAHLGKVYKLDLMSMFTQNVGYSHKIDHPDGAEIAQCFRLTPLD